MKRVAHFAALALLGLGACGFFLEGVPERSDTCTFDGTFSLCGQCVIDSCQLDVDACCQDDCGGALELLDRCAGDDDVEACRELKEDDGIGSCVRTSCDSACRSTGLASRCTIFSDTCSCDLGDEPNTVLCPAVDDPDVVCCADPGWPGFELSCECARVGCTDTIDQCFCGPGVEDDTPGCDAVTFDLCCVTFDGCVCGFAGEVCYDGEVEVQSCADGGFTCDLDRERVDRCHVDE